MSKEEKTIDGLKVRRGKDSSLVTRSQAGKIAAKRKKPVVKKKMTVQKKEAVAEAHEDFLAPVETFSFGEIEETGTSEGRVEEVEDDEVIEMKQIKKSKKEFRQEKKQAKLDAKKMAEQHSGKKKSKKKKVILTIVIILLILIIGAGAYVYFWGNDLIKKITGGEGDVWSAIGAMTSETYEPLKTDENGRTNILLYGTSGYDMDGSEGNGTHDGSQLTDSIMVFSLDQKTGDVAMVSLPRDLKAGYTCTATGKVNEVYWCAMQRSDNEADGAAALQAKISEILGVDTQYYIHMNWGALVNIVDTLGGIKVTLDEDINDYYYTKAVYKAGVEYTLTGEDALGLSRARHGTDHGDFSRGNSQQKILIGIKEKIVEKGLGLTDVISILNMLGDNLRTNFNMGEIKTGMHILEEYDLENMRQIALVGDENYMTTANINGISYVVPRAGADNYTQVKEYIAKMLVSDPVAREGAKVEILNGTGEAGVAATEQAKLEEKGYTVIKIGDAPEGAYSYDAEVEIYDTSEGKMPETKKALEERYGVEMKAEAELPNGISGYGVDFIIIVGK